MNFFIAVFEQIILFLPLTFGVFFSYVILQTTDITVDGSFVLGACVFASMSNILYNPILATICAVALGAAAGIGVSIISKRNIITPLIASILVLFMLQSINLQIMGRPNIGIPQNHTLFSFFPSCGQYAQIIVLIVCALLVTIALYVLLKTRLGLFLRACGSNQTLFTRLGKNSEHYRGFGIALSNAVAAFCGTLTAQVNGYADISMGFGIALIGIATVTFGQQMLKPFSSKKPFNPLAGLSSCLIGTTFYFLAVNVLLLVGIDPLNLKLFLGLGLILFLKAARQTHKKQL